MNTHTLIVPYIVISKQTHLKCLIYITSSKHTWTSSESLSTATLFSAKQTLKKEKYGLPIHLSFWAICLFSLYVVVLSIQPVLTCFYITTKSIFIYYYQHSAYIPWPFWINQTWSLTSSHSSLHLLTATTLPQHRHTQKIFSKFWFVLLAVSPHLCEQSTPVWVMTCLFT